MSAVKSIAPDLIPQHRHPQHPYQTPVPGGGGPSVQSTVPASYCGPGGSGGGGGATLPRGQSPDIGYVSLEHPSRSASYVSQASMQFRAQQPNEHCRNSFGSSDKTPPPPPHPPSREIQTQGRSKLPDNSTTRTPDSGLTSFRSSQNSVHSCNHNINSLMSKRSNSAFDVASTPPRILIDDPAIQDMYSMVTNSHKGTHSATEAAVKPCKTTTPASKDSNPGVSDLRNLLTIKETELRMMRETMARNESAILQVFEDKKRKWQVEMSDRKKEWEGQLQAVQNRAWKADQLLQFQVAKLHQENRRLQGHGNELEEDKRRLSERCHTLTLELEGLKGDMRGLLSLTDVREKDTDVINQVRSSTVDPDPFTTGSNYAKVTHSSPDNTNKNQVSSEVNPGTTNPWQKRRVPAGANDTLNVPVRGALSLPELQRELENSRREVESCRKDFEQERQNWKTEKEKVIDYQKRLQLSYLQVLHKNRLLELDVQQLTGEMAASDIRQLTAGEDTPLTRPDATESHH